MTTKKSNTREGFEIAATILVLGFGGWLVFGFLVFPFFGAVAGTFTVRDDIRHCSYTNNLIRTDLTASISISRAAMAMIVPPTTDQKLNDLLDCLSQI